MARNNNNKNKNGKGNSFRRRSRRRPSKGSRRATVNKSVVKVVLPDQLENSLILLDQDDFYRIYLDLLMFNSQNSPVSPVSNHAEYKAFREKLSNGGFKGNTYFIDETFGWGIVNVERLIAFIRENDESAHIVGLTAMAREDILDENQYDSIAVKSRKIRDDNVIGVLESRLKISFIESNADPEYKGKEHMEVLMESGDNFPQKIYRDKK